MLNLLATALLILQSSGGAPEFRAPSIWSTRAVSVGANQSQGRRRLPPAVRTGAAIGATVGFVTGVVVWKRGSCEEFACLAEGVALPLFLFGYTVVGGVAGAGIGFVVYVLSPERDARVQVGLRVPL